VALLANAVCDDMGGGGERGIQRRVRRRGVTEADIVRNLRMHLRSALRIFQMDERGLRFIIDDHLLGRILGEIAVVGDDKGDGIAREADVANGQKRWHRRLDQIREYDAQDVAVLDHVGAQILTGEDRDDPFRTARLLHIYG
jgi:hypothetical protein